MNHIAMSDGQLHSLRGYAQLHARIQALEQRSSESKRKLERKIWQLESRLEEAENKISRNSQTVVTFNYSFWRRIACSVNFHTSNTNSGRRPEASVIGD
jgi:hypothetical protein